MADDRLRFILDFVTQTAGLKSAQELAELLGEDLGNAEDAGKQMAAALKVAADKAQKDLKETTAIADKLAQALGPELTAKVNVDEIATKFHHVGMTVEDVDANIDSFRSSLSRMADTADTVKSRMGDVDQAVQRVGDTTDRSRGVMANYVGNAAQEIPGLTGAFGPLNTAIGQFAEYATEGGISLAGMASTIGPMAALGASIWYATNQLELMAKKDAFHTDRVKAYEEQIRKSGNSAKALADHIREVGKVEASTWGNNANPFADATTDVTERLLKAGLSVDQYAQLVSGGVETTKRWIAAQRDAGNSIDPAVLDSLTQDVQDYADAQDRATASAEFFGDNAAGSAHKLDQLAAATERQNKAWDDMNSRMEKDDAFAQLTIDLLGLQGQLDDIAKQEADGAISHEEAMARRVLAIDGVRGSTDSYMQTLLKLPPDMATKVNILIDNGEFQKALDLLRTYQELDRYRADARNSAPTPDRPTVSPGNGLPMTGYGATPVVEVHSTTNLSVGHNFIGAITTLQRQAAKGAR